jgi:hypothetical protein
MAIDSNFKVKETLQAGASGLFLEAIKVGGASANWTAPTFQPDTVAIQAFGQILSGDTDLADFIGDGLQSAAEGTSQGQIKFNTQTDISYTDINVNGVGTDDSPTFVNLELTGTSNTSTIKGASTLLLDPAAHGDDTGTVKIAGDLVVDGTTTTINSTTIELSSAIVQLGIGDYEEITNSSSLPSGGVGIQAANITGATIVYKSDEWHIAHDLNIGETLDVTGNTTLGGTLAVTGDTTLNGAVTIGDAGSDTTIINSTSIELPNVPVSDGVTTVLTLSSDGAGTEQIATDEIDSRVWGTTLVDSGNDGGTTGTIAKFTDGNTVADSVITEASGVIEIAGSLDTTDKVTIKASDAVGNTAQSVQDVITGTTDATTGNLTLSLLAVNSFKAIELLVNITNGTDVGVIKLLAVCSGSTVEATTFGEVVTGNVSFGTLDLTSNGTNLSLALAAATSGSTVSVKITSIM